MSEVVAGLPTEAAEAASDSVGAASRIASMLPSEIAVGLIATAKSGFTDALGVAVLVAGAIAAIGAVLVARFMPARHLPDNANGGTGGQEVRSDLADDEAETT